MRAFSYNLGRPMRMAFAAVFILPVVVGAAVAGGGGSLHMVSQKGRAFQPGQMAIKRGDTIEIVNDDGDLLHHAYIDTDGFSFDSGDQEPGSKTNIVFSKAGTFTVLCGIHPKMNLVVSVQD